MHPDKPPQKLLTPDEVAERLRWHRKSVYRACKEGRIPSQKIGGRIYIPESAVTIEEPAEIGGAEA